MPVEFIGRTLPITEIYYSFNVGSAMTEVRLSV